MGDNQKKSKMQNRMRIPSIVLTAHATPGANHGETPVKVMEKFGLGWGMKPEYEVKAVRNSEDEPTTYVAILTIGFRKGHGSGATIPEAKAEAAAYCIDDLSYFVTEDQRIPYKPVVKTDPNKDILHVIQSICTDYNFQKPTYKFVVKEDGGFKYTASFGKLSATGVAAKKRVAIRIAAVNLYKEIMDSYNPRKVAASVKKQKPKEAKEHTGPIPDSTTQ